VGLLYYVLEIENLVWL